MSNTNKDDINRIIYHLNYSLLSMAYNFVLIVKYVLWVSRGRGKGRGRGRGGKDKSR